MTTALLQTTYFGPIQWYQKLYRYVHCLIEQYDSYQKQTYRNRCLIATANGIQALTVPVEHSPLTSHHSPLVKDLRISDHNQWRRVHWNALQSAYSESPFFDYYADDLHPFFERKYNYLIDFNEAIRQKICELIDIQPSVEYTSSYISNLFATPHSQRENVQCKDLRISDHNQWRRVHWNALQSAYSESPFFDYYADDIRPFFERKYDFLIDFNEAIRQKMCELIDIHPHVEYTSSYTSAISHQPSAIADFRDVIHAKHPQPDATFEARKYWQVFQHKHGFLPNLSILDLLFNMGPESIFYL